MPITAKLSREFYDKLGNEVANELVNWFNQVDAAYRSDLRELNELNFSRFDAKLEQRLAELRAGFDSKLEQGLTAVRVDLLKWMFALWVGNVAATIAIIATALKLAH